MDREQTRALLAKGEEAWNAWAILALQGKQRLETNGLWLADWFGEGQNEATQGWLADARADFSGIEFASDASLQNLVFPGPAIFDGAHFLGKADLTGARFAFVARFQNTRFDGEAHFERAEFHHLAVFDDAAFASAAYFEKAEFLRPSTGPLSPAARFRKTQFASRAEFRGGRFAGHAEFTRARFGGNARFDEAEFLGDASFEGASFEGTAGLVKARFSGGANFDKAHFASDARLGETEFKGPARFEGASFGGKASFRMVRFGAEACFDDAGFEADARFSEAQFADAARLRKVSFEEAADFQKAVFAKTAELTGCCFEEEADFSGATFTGAADFSDCRFKSGASFTDAAFLSDAGFAQAGFKGRAGFRAARFAGRARFEAVQSRGPFVLAGCRFAEVPCFQEASFRESPRLDDIAIADPMRYFPRRPAGERDPRPFFLRAMKVVGASDIAARYRRLRQFAAEAKDYEREQHFFAQELRARRFVLDKPFGRGFGRFWFGWLYGGLSDFGRSFGRPLFVWAMTVPLFALVYLATRRSIIDAGVPGLAATGTPPSPPNWPAQPDLMAVMDWSRRALDWLWQTITHHFASGGCIVGDSKATAEAFFLSLKNSFFFLGWESQDAARRVYSCLYGLEDAASSQGLRVPLVVSSAAIVQNLVSAALLFLIFLALRNLLKAR